MDRLIHSTHYDVYKFLSMLVSKLNQASERDTWYWEKCPAVSIRISSGLNELRGKIMGETRAT